MTTPSETVSLSTLPRLQRGDNAARLPERIVQFGTGGFLRGFAEYFIELANQRDEPLGSVVMVASTSGTRVDAINDQDGLFTLITRGRADGQVIDKTEIITCVSRALSAADEWDAVLDLAHSPDIGIIISNTTEIGISYNPDDRPYHNPPASFPAKLTAFLHARATAFDFDTARGVIILPCELLENNGDRLKEIVVRHSNDWELGDAFLNWLDEAVLFCNTLVDRIVPGAPEGDDAEKLARRLGFRDDLMTITEPFRLWAIEWPQKSTRAFPFQDVDDAIVQTGDIHPYRTLKVRILNGSHSIMVPTGLLLGISTVGEAMQHPLMSDFTRRIIFQEIVPSLDVDPELASSFARDTVDRFENPFLQHELRSISLQQTMKTRVRVLPSLRSFAAKFGYPPPAITFGLAALIYYKLWESAGNTAADDADNVWRELASNRQNSERTALQVLENETLWGTGLADVPGLVEAVAEDLDAIQRDGIALALQNHLARIESEAHPRPDPSLSTRR